MAKLDKSTGYYFVLPHDVKTLQKVEDGVFKMAVSNIKKLHKKYYEIDLMKETDQLNFYGKQLPYRVL